MADSSQEGSSQSRNPSPARDRSSDGESDGATKPAARASSGTRCTGPSCSRWAMTFKADEPWTHHRLCGTHLVCTPSGAVCAVCSDWSAGDLEDLQGQRSPASKRSGITGLCPGKPVPSPRQRPGSRYPPVPSPIVLDSPDPSGAEAPHGKKKDVRRTSRPSRTHKKKRGSILPRLLLSPLLPARPPGRRQTEDVDIGLRRLGTVTTPGTVTTLDTVRGGQEVANVGLRPPSLRRQHAHQGRVSPLMVRCWSSCCSKPLAGFRLQRLPCLLFLIPAKDQLRRRHPRQPQ